MLFIGVCIGFVIGMVGTLVVLGICASAAEADEAMEREAEARRNEILPMVRRK